MAQNIDVALDHKEILGEQAVNNKSTKQIKCINHIKSEFARKFSTFAPLADPIHDSNPRQAATGEDQPDPRAIRPQKKVELFLSQVGVGPRVSPLGTN